MADYQVELDDAVANLDRHYGELKQAAAERLGSLYNPARLPRDAGRASSASPGSSPASSRRTTSCSSAPGSTRQERARVAARFEEAVQLAEQAFLEEFARLVAHLSERVADDGGEAKVFRDSAVDNLAEFFERFRTLNVRSNDQLDELVAQAQRAVRGRRRRRTCATAGRCGGPWPRTCPGCSRRWTGCWWTGPGAASSARRPRRGVPDGPGRRPRRPGPVRLRRGDRPGRPRPPAHRPGQPRRARRPTAAGTADLAPVGGPVLGPFAAPQRGPGGRARLAGGALAAPRPDAAPADLATGARVPPAVAGAMSGFTVSAAPRIPSHAGPGSPGVGPAAPGRPSRDPEEPPDDPAPARPRRRRRHRRVRSAPSTASASACAAGPPADLEPEDLCLAVDCPFCGRALPPWPARRRPRRAGRVRPAATSTSTTAAGEVYAAAGVTAAA